MQQARRMTPSSWAPSTSMTRSSMISCCLTATASTSAGGCVTQISPAVVSAAYDTLQAPKWLIVLGNIGHNAFGDTCLAICSGDDLIDLAKQLGIGIP